MTGSIAGMTIAIEPAFDRKVRPRSATMTGSEVMPFRACPQHPRTQDEPSEVGDAGFVSAQGDADQILHPGEDILDAVSPTVGRLVELFRVTPVLFRWDHGGASSCRQIVADGVCVERLVGNDGDAFNRTQQRFGKDTVVSLAWRQTDADDLLRLPAHRGANF